MSGIVGLGKACEIAFRDLSINVTRMKELRDRLHNGITKRVTDIRLNGHPEHRLPNTLNVSFKGIEANRLLEEIGLEIAASAGAACHSGSVAISHVLEAMQIPVEWAQGSVRFSVGRMTTVAGIDQALEVIVAVTERLRKHQCADMRVH